MEKKMETTLVLGLYWGYIGIMEKKMGSTIYCASGFGALSLHALPIVILVLGKFALVVISTIIVAINKL